MSLYDPLGPNSSVPPALERLSCHPERGQWKGAALLGRASRRWPHWPLKMALAAVSGELEFEAVDFIVRPPFGWTEDERYEPPSHLSLEGVVEQGLSPRQAVSLMNEIFGTMRVANNFAFGDPVEDRLAAGSGIKPSWCCAFFQFSESSVRIDLGGRAYAEFGTRFPADGDLLARVTEWAEGYVTAQRALNLLAVATQGADPSLGR